MIYKVYTREQWIINEDNVYYVEADSSEEALNKFNEGDYDDQNCDSYSYGERVSQTIDKLTDEDDNVIAL